MKLTAGVDFINILHPHFSYKRASRSFSLLHFGFIIFRQKDIGKKSGRKMLIKLTTVYRSVVVIKVGLYVRHCFGISTHENVKTDTFCRLNTKYAFTFINKLANSHYNNRYPHFSIREVFYCYRRKMTPIVIQINADLQYCN